MAVHSLIKNLNGHLDVVARAVAGSAAFTAKVGSIIANTKFSLACARLGLAMVLHSMST